MVTSSPDSRVSRPGKACTAELPPARSTPTPRARNSGCQRWPGSRKATNSPRARWRPRLKVRPSWVREPMMTRTRGSPAAVSAAVGGRGVAGAAVEDQQLPLVERLGLEGPDGGPEQRTDVLGAHQDRDDRPGRLGGVLVGAGVGVEVGQHLPLAGGAQRVVAELAPRDVRVAATDGQRGVPGRVRRPPGQRAELVVAGRGALLVDPLGVDERVRRQPVAARALGDVPERRREVAGLPDALAGQPGGLEERVRRDVGGVDHRAGGVLGGAGLGAELGGDPVEVEQARGHQVPGRVPRGRAHGGFDHGAVTRVTPSPVGGPARCRAAAR